MAAGAIIAGASKEDVAACEVFAEKIGLAFQSKYCLSVLRIIARRSTHKLAQLDLCSIALKVVYFLQLPPN